MKFVYTILSMCVVSLAFGQGRKPNEFTEETNPTNSNFEFYSQKGGNSRRATFDNVKKGMLPNVQVTPIVYVPVAVGNVSNRGDVVKDPNGDIWYIDGAGDGMKFIATGGDPTMGGDLTGTASNAQLGTGVVGTNEIQNGSVALGDLAFTPIITEVDGSTSNELQNLGYTAATRALAISSGTGVTLPLFTSTDAGLVPLSGGGSANFLRADGTWAAPVEVDGSTSNELQNLGYTAATRALAISSGTGVTLPLFTSTDAGLVPLSGGGTSNFLRADGTWAAPAGGGGISGLTTNYVVKATSATTVGNSLIFDNGTNIGINHNSPSALVDVRKTDNTTASQTMMYTLLTKNVTGGSVGSLRSLNNQLFLQGTADYTSAISQLNYVLWYASGVNSIVTATQSRFDCSAGAAASSLTLYGTHFEGTGTGVISNLYGLAISVPNVATFTNVSNTITNTYGVYVGDITVGTQTNVPWSAYFADTNARSYFGGLNGFGSASAPSEAAHVGGNLLVTGVVKNADGSASVPSYSFNNDQNTGTYRPTNDTWAVTTNGSERMRVKDDGSVLIGNTTGANELTVSGTANVFMEVYTPSTFGNAGIFLGNSGDGNNSYAIFRQADGDLVIAQSDTYPYSSDNEIMRGTKARTTVKTDVLNIEPISAATASALTPTNGDLVHVNTTNGTFTALGLWGRENGIWVKM